MTLPKWVWSCSVGHPALVTLRAQLEGHAGVQSLDPLGTFSPHLLLPGAGPKSGSYRAGTLHLSIPGEVWMCWTAQRNPVCGLCTSDSHSLSGLTRCLLFQSIMESKTPHYLKVYLPHPKYWPLPFPIQSGTCFYLCHKTPPSLTPSKITLGNLPSALVDSDCFLEQHALIWRLLTFSVSIIL